jgi:hypothetical protein
MNSTNTEIRRRADGSIDITHYIAQCHHQRSLAAHRTIGRSFNAPWSLIRNLILRWSNRAPARGDMFPAE